jgi:hypothetical protein
LVWLYLSLGSQLISTFTDPLSVAAAVTGGDCCVVVVVVAAAVAAILDAAIIIASVKIVACAMRGLPFFFLLLRCIISPLSANTIDKRLSLIKRGKMAIS